MPDREVQQLLARFFPKEAHGLLKARVRFLKRLKHLFNEDGTWKHSEEETARRMAELEGQFERAARRLEKRAASVEEAASRTLRLNRYDTMARARLEASRVARDRASELRAEIASVVRDVPTEGEANSNA
jgi:hypothetical protein